MHKSNVKFQNIHVNANSNFFKMETWPKISLDEGKITNIFKEVFEEKFKKQEVRITKIISGHFMLTMRELQSLTQEVNDLDESIEFTQNDLLENVSDVEKKISTFEIKMNEVYDYQIDPNYVNDSLSDLQHKMLEMEYRPTGNSISVDGVTKGTVETWGDCEKKSLEILRDKL